MIDGAKANEPKKTVLEEISFRGEVSEVPDGIAVLWETSALWGGSRKPEMQASALWGCDISGQEKP
jgi:hypothetical protein